MNFKHDFKLKVTENIYIFEEDAQPPPNPNYEVDVPGVDSIL